MSNQSAKIQKLITKGDDVLKTHKPNPPNIIGFPTCDAQLFTSWRTQSLSFLEKNFGITNPYYSEFSNKVLTAHVGHIKTGLGVLNAVKEELDDTLDEYCKEKAEELLVVDDISSKIFISHATKDRAIVEELIEILESIGIESSQIFCSSFEGYGIPLGENFLEQIKQELSSDILVLFVLTKNFYESKICLCEMGAAWALSKKHIPIVVPPLSYKDIEGVIPLTQGLIITESSKLNSLKERLEKEFTIERRLSFSTWERKRDRFIRDINTHLSDV